MNIELLVSSKEYLITNFFVKAQVYISALQLQCVKVDVTELSYNNVDLNFVRRARVIIKTNKRCV